jgi:transcriptional regulator with XRE-family HTH domain
MGRASIERPKYLARKLMSIRDSLGLSQNQMIVRLDLDEKLTQAEVSAFELGKRVPPLVVLLRYARAAQIHVDDLIDDEVRLQNHPK